MSLNGSATRRALVGLAVTLATVAGARQQAGLTQDEVARALLRPQSFVSKCESGERRVDVIELADFAKLYGKPIAFFLG